MGVRRLERSVMDAIFLSASVPIIGRGHYHENADPFLIQCAVREFVSTTLGRRLIVWGGHPAITPMVWAVCEDLGVSYAASVVLYQSLFFKKHFPDEDKNFANVAYVDAIDGDREASLNRMREQMLSRTDLTAAVFIGGMEGVFDEHKMFAHYHPTAPVIAVPSAGGAARDLWGQIANHDKALLNDLDYASLFHTSLAISSNEPRAGFNQKPV